MAGVRYEIDGPHERWKVTMATKRQSVLSKELVNFDVSASLAGLPVNPTSKTVEVAFLTSSRAEPGAEDWKAAAWDTTLIGTYVAQCLVGPGGTFVPVAGRYYTWVRIIDVSSLETVIRQVGMLWID